MPLRALFVTFFLTSATLGFAQQGDMQQWIMGDSQQQTEQRLTSLGVEKSAVSGLKEPQFEHVTWNSLRTHTREQYATLFLPCTLDTAYLYLVTKKEADWHVIDSLKLDCHYDLNVSVEISYIRNSSIDEVMIHHACDGHGTGILQQNFMVVTVVGDKFRTELETEEVLNVSRANGGPKYELNQRSTFAAIPIRQSNSRAIEETRSKTLNGKMTVQRRIFRWNANSGHYLPSKFVDIEVNGK
jgi:hypothetical protein